MTSPANGLPMKDLQHLSKIQNHITQVNKGTTETIAAKKRQCAITLVALAILALLAVAGAAVLIIKSGGPSGIFPFYSGVALGTVAAGLMVWMAVAAMRASQAKKREMLKGVETRDTPVGHSQILDAMHDAQQNKDGIEKVVQQLTGENFAAFVKEAELTILTEGRAAADLTTQEQVILTSIASHKEVTPEVQRKLVEFIPQTDVNTIVQNMSQEHYENSLNTALEEGHDRLLKAMIADSKFQTLARGTRTTYLATASQETVNAYVIGLSSEQFNEYVQFVKETFSSDQDDKLRIAIAQRPADFAQFVIQSETSSVSEEFIMKVVEEMTQKQTADFLEQFKKYLILNKETQDPKNREVSYIVYAILKDVFAQQALEKPLLDQVKLLPGYLANLIFDMQVNVAVFDAVWENMGDKIRPNFIQGLQGLVEDNPKQFWTETLKTYGSKLPKALQATLAATQFSYSEFRELVVDNEGISKAEGQRHQFTLNIIELMGEKAPTVISELDNFRIGHARYVNMLKILAQEATNSSGVATPSRKQLYKYFKEAPQFEKVNKNELNLTAFNQAIESK